MKSFATLTLLILALVTCGLLATSCGGDDPSTACTNCTPIVKPNLTKQADVLAYVELAYNKRNLSRYEEVLDEDFTFFPSSYDVQRRGFPQSWGRTEEVDFHAKLFDPNYGGTRRVKSLHLDLPDGSNIQWESFDSPIPGETWYRTTVSYEYSIEITPYTVRANSPGTQATFVIRNAGTEEAPHWQLVEMYDLGVPNSPAARSSI